MSGEDDRRALRYLIHVVNENGPLCAQVVDDVLVVNYLVPHEHRRAEYLDRFVHHLDRALYPRTESAWLSQDHSHLGYVLAWAAADGAPVSAYSPRYSGGNSSAIRRMISSVPAATASRVIRLGFGKRYGSPNLACAFVRRNRSLGSLTCSVPQIATGSTRAPVRSAISAVPGSARPSLPPLRVPSGNMPSTCPRRRASCDRRIARRSPSKRRTGMKPPMLYNLPSNGKSKSSCLAIQTMRRGNMPIRRGGSPTLKWLHVKMRAPLWGMFSLPTTSWLVTTQSAALIHVQTFSQ